MKKSFTIGIILCFFGAICYLGSFYFYSKKINNDIEKEVLLLSEIQKRNLFMIGYIDKISQCTIENGESGSHIKKRDLKSGVTEVTYVIRNNTPNHIANNTYIIQDYNTYESDIEGRANEKLEESRESAIALKIANCLGEFIIRQSPSDLTYFQMSIYYLYLSKALKEKQLFNINDLTMARNLVKLETVALNNETEFSNLFKNNNEKQCLPIYKMLCESIKLEDKNEAVISMEVKASEHEKLKNEGDKIRELLKE